MTRATFAPQALGGLLAVAGFLGLLFPQSSCQPEGPAASQLDPSDLPHRSGYLAKTDAELRRTLSELEYKVTRQEGTEPPFKNRYWNNKAEGIYIDLISGAPLFSSEDKYDSGTGWPSFTRPLDPEEIVLRDDHSLGTVRSEVRSRAGDAHLGHVFDDGPPPMGLRYCLNSAALRFVPKERLAELGYGEFLPLFQPD
ncbi:MAG TPA: peptide-methionine (R)-S-oxide reductase MsrB [Verrucomicrobiales bacterium]|nr:peptide-methionine (R)-S-oxide reductase MsrB [Verrucomicrobiales bacterium]